MKKTITNSQGLTAKQQKAVFMLTEGYKLIDVAKALEITRETVSHWIKKPEFIAEFDRILNEFAVSSMLNLSGASEDAARVIRELVNDENIKPETRLKAAIATFDVLKNAELVRIQAEIDQLHQIIKDKSNND
ncbi:MAG: phBC6A51 family helix-turn-helix protein [Prochloraceae cyanobacterium]|nr:phBC6A51 family helix-turn-helix protein [Prochloraceae cyanobacterium]